MCPILKNLKSRGRPFIVNKVHKPHNTHFNSKFNYTKRRHLLQLKFFPLAKRIIVTSFNSTMSRHQNDVQTNAAGTLNVEAHLKAQYSKLGRFTLSKSKQYMEGMRLK